MKMGTFEPMISPFTLLLQEKEMPFESEFIDQLLQTILSVKSEILIIL